MDQLVVSLVVILIPGILAAVICDKITVHSTWDSFKFGLYAFVLGLGSYVTLQIGCYLVEMIRTCSFAVTDQAHLRVWNSAIANGGSIPASEVVLATLISIPVAFVASYMVNYKIINKAAQKMKVSTKYGDENLFSYYLNAKEVEWVYVRDFENNLTYQGRVDSYSENEDMQEIVLYDVTVFRYEDSAELYSVPTIYLTKEIGKFVIEAIPKNLLGAGNDTEASTN